jgi:hypothetical protein
MILDIQVLVWDRHTNVAGYVTEGVYYILNVLVNNKLYLDPTN